MPDSIRIGCRVPSGLILRVYDYVGEGEDRELREVGSFHLQGPDASSGDGDRAAYTKVDKRLFELWMALNRATDLVAEGSVFEAQAGDVPLPMQTAAPVSEPVRTALLADGPKARGKV